MAGWWDVLIALAAEGCVRSGDLTLVKNRIGK